jgi:hypothetical protein
MEAVAVGVLVGDGEDVYVCVTVGVAVCVGVFVDVGTAVGVGVGPTHSWLVIGALSEVSVVESTCTESMVPTPVNS